MSKSNQARDTARVFVSPLFAWSNAVLKGGEIMLDSMAAAAKNAQTVRVAVIPEAEAPRRRKAAGGRTKAKRARRRG